MLPEFISIFIFILVNIFIAILYTCSTKWQKYVFGHFRKGENFIPISNQNSFNVFKNESQARNSNSNFKTKHPNPVKSKAMIVLYLHAEEWWWKNVKGLGFPSLSCCISTGEKNFIRTVRTLQQAAVVLNLG